MSATAEQQPRMRWLSAIVLGVAGLFYAYAVWNAVAYLVTMAQLGLNGFGWFLLLFVVLFPAIVFALAYGIGRRRPVGELALVLLAGLGLTAVFWMNALSYTTVNIVTLIG